MTLTELLRPKSEEDWLDRLLLYAMGDPRLNALPVTDWESGGAARTYLQLFARTMAEMDAVRVSVAESGFLARAHGGWLDELTASQYQLARKPSAFAQGVLTLACLAGLGPYTILPGQLWVSTEDGHRWNNTSGGTLTAGMTLALEFRAESPGSEYNAPVGTITKMLTPLPGVSISNLAGWLLVAGAEAETDVSLSYRAAARWAELGGGGVRAAYEYWALSSSPSVTKVRVLDQHPRGQGTVDVVIWGEGGIGSSVVLTADTYIQARRPVTADVLVQSAVEVVVPVTVTLSGTVTDRPATLAQVQANLRALQIATPIGGTLFAAAIIEAAMLPPGVVNAVLSVTTADVRLGPKQVLTLAPTIVWGIG